MKIRNNTSPLTLTEKQFLSQIVDLLKLFHWKFEHTFEQGVYARRTSKGFPDIVAVRPPRLLFIELKSEKGKLTEDQEAWIDALEGCQKVITTEPLDVSGKVAYLRMVNPVPILTIPEVYVFRPSQFEEITEILK